MQVPSCQLCIWTAVFWCLLKSRRPHPPQRQPNRPRWVSHNLQAPMGNKFQGPPVQEPLRRRSAPPQTRQARRLKVHPANLKGRPAPQHQPAHQQNPPNCKTAGTDRDVHGNNARADLYNLTCSLRLSLFSTSEQSRIGIPTLGDTIDGHANPPAIVIYIVDAFLTGSGRNEVEEEGDEVEAGSIWLLGLLRCYTEMLQTLPEGIRPALVLQVERYLRKIRARFLRHNSAHHLYVMSFLPGGFLPAPPSASQRGEPFVPAVSPLLGLLLLLPVPTPAAPTNIHQVPDRLWTSVHRQLCS